MHPSITFLALVCLLSVIYDETSCAKSLCDDPYIHSADRLSNNTYRVYRDDYYWDLIGLPQRVAKVKGPYKIWWSNMAPMTRDAAVFTVIGGSGHGITYKFQKNKMWSWSSKGSQRIGDRSGESWSLFPKDTPFSAAFNDGNLDKKGYPMLIAFSDIRAYYFRTSSLRFVRIGDEQGYIPPGQFEEDFPGDLTAAMPFPSDDEDVKYYVYLFKREEHCFRPITGEKGCKEWRKNKELFGCLTASAGGGAKEKPKEDLLPDNRNPEPESNTEPSNTGEEGKSGGNNNSPTELYFLFVLMYIFI